MTLVVTLENKNNASLNLESKLGLGLTWDQDTNTWDKQEGTWDVLIPPNTLENKNTASLTLENKA